MPLKINYITPNSIGSTLPLRIGDLIVSVDKHIINDVLDLLYHTQKDEFTIEYINETNETKQCKTRNISNKPLGYETALPDCSHCINDCIFCFISQMPKGLRDSLYIKDDDFSYSFFYGNFISLTNLSPMTLKKIISQRISPLYISVHTTNPKLHKKIFRYNIDFNIKETLDILSKNNIDIHTQVVLIPEINDGKELLRTLSELMKLKNIQSIGIVPVGLTKHRENLSILKKVTPELARNIISEVSDLYINERTHFNLPCKANIYLADEFYILANHKIPPNEYYDNYDQIENGIGMVRKARENYIKHRRKYIKLISEKEGNPVFVTSILGWEALKPILRDMKKQLVNSTKIIKQQIISNLLFGESVTVTGLLSWDDIKNQLTIDKTDYLVLSSAMFNHEMKTLDGYYLSDIEKTLDSKPVIINELWDFVLNH
jgi:putative radical SAM enzyme (TIGR03279 family)